MKGELPLIKRRVTRDGVKGAIVVCPLCSVEGFADEDQLLGRVSIECECGYHETVRLVAP